MRVRYVSFAASRLKSEVCETGIEKRGAGINTMQL
jgi:hypothetical protein